MQNSFVLSCIVNFPVSCSWVVPHSLLAVSTPGSKELHQPHVIAPQHHLVKVVVSELDHVLLAVTVALLLEKSWALLKSVRVARKRSCVGSHQWVYLLAVARAARLAAKPLFHQSAQSVHGSIHNGLAAASAWTTSEDVINKQNTRPQNIKVWVAVNFRSKIS